MKLLLVWLVLCLIWGSTWAFIKIGLADLPPLTFAAIRFIIAICVLSLVAVASRAQVPRQARDWLLIAVTGLLGFGFNYGLLFWGEQHISSGLAAVLQATIPAFGYLFAHYHLPSERLTFVKAFAITLGIIGVAIIFSDQLQLAGRMALLGCIAVVVGAICVAYANVLIKARGGNLHPAMLAAGQMMFGLVPLLAVGLTTEGNPAEFHWTKSAITALLYLALVGSVLAFLLYYWLIKRMDVTKVMLISLVTPFVAVLLGWLALGEQLAWRTLAGGVCILLGILLVWKRRVDLTPSLDSSTAEGT